MNVNIPHNELEPEGRYYVFGIVVALSLLVLAVYAGLALSRWACVNTNAKPVSRFWPLQFIEGGCLLALSAVLIATTVWLVRRRAT